MALVEREFGEAYQTELATLLQRRFRLLCAVWAGILIILLIADLADWWGQWVPFASYVSAHGLQLVVIGAMWRRQESKAIRGHELLRMSFWMVVLNAAIASVVFHAVSGEGGVGLLPVGVGFLLACLILPWTPTQAARPGIAVWLVWVLAQLVFARVEFGLKRVVLDVLAGLLVVPMGLLECWIRTRAIGKRVESTSLRQHYEEFHRELFDARKIHEAIFPRPKSTGAIRFAFRDAPRLGIGGDLLAAHESPDGSLHLIMLDVAGDGIAAALTVHRLHGEIERLFAESAHLRPRDVIAALDRYAHLTLAPHGVFATGFAMRFEESGAARWCGAGHAPAFIRHGDGSLTRLLSTTWPLGASDRLCEDFEERIEAMEPEDVLIAYSDGACDWRNRKGQWLGYSGAEAIVRTTTVEDPLKWPDAFLRQLNTFRGWQGEPDEDVLILAVNVGAPVVSRTGLRTSRFFRSRTAEPVQVEVGA